MSRCKGRPLVDPINGQNFWPKTQNEPICHQFINLVSKPNKLRRRKPDEDPNPSKLKRSHSTNKCKRCRQLGHNVRKFKMPPPEEPAATDGEGEPTNVALVVAEEGAKQPRPRVTNKFGKVANQAQPYVPPFAQDKTMATLLAHLVNLKNTWQVADGFAPSQAIQNQGNVTHVVHEGRDAHDEGRVDVDEIMVGGGGSGSGSKSP
ncbi:hypothetical protein SESBI_38022 [Sesbania bispinosa]|nr:hypothetical protein SESBI_38022 [Sesbania bispinosa]